MSALSDDFSGRATACAVDICWRQWRTLASVGVGEAPAASIIDPEALVLLSLMVRSDERRLDDQLLWWAESGSSLMSVQRMRTLLADAPQRVREGIGEFAATAVSAGDARWKVLVRPGQKPLDARRGKGPRELQLIDPATLMLRLRAGFGVGAKADLLTFLLGAAGRVGEASVLTTAEGIAKGLSYSVASVRRAASDMALARLIESGPDRPVQYAVDAKSWSDVLNLRDPLVHRDGGQEPVVPAWRFWSHVFAFLAACVALGEDASVADAPPVVQASHARDVAERFRRALSWSGIEWVDPRQFPGTRYLDAFGVLLTRVVELVGLDASV
jgi:hypothetical protein